ncbi:MAG: hypothetical protein Q8M76_00880, partial [Spirochaetaceae bacterium]|nr:hypothetical protein [Spirochaetaceae bacterium]
MRDERPTLIAPDPADLPLLFEASRLLGRHTDVAEAMGPLLGLLMDRGGLAGGRAALPGWSSGAGLPDEADIVVVAVAESADAGLVGKRVEMGEGAMGKALVASAPCLDSGLLALPVALGGSAIGAI